jgi:hypothetical protein
MDLDQAIAVHSGWKQKLSAYLRNPDKSIDVAKLAKDDQCELGQWIKTESARYASDSAFQTLKKEHSKFHCAAADLVRRADAGQNTSEEVSLGSKSAYANSSPVVVYAITQLKRARAS